MSWLGNLRDLFRTIDGLLQVEQRHGATIDDLKDRVSRLEANGPVLVAEAKAAASAVAAQHIGDLARRIGILEERLRHQDGSDSRRRLSDN